MVRTLQLRCALCRQTPCSLPGDVPELASRLRAMAVVIYSLLVVAVLVKVLALLRSSPGQRILLVKDLDDLP